MLRDFARKLYAQTVTKDDNQSTRGSLSDVQLHLTLPLYGEVDGHAVTIIGQGNMAGFSPVSFCIDGSGENAWLPTSSVLITDQRFQPVGLAARSAARTPASGGTSTRGRTTRTTEKAAK